MSASVYLINIRISSKHQDLLICIHTANARHWSLETGLQCVLQTKWTYMHWCQGFVHCTMHVYRLLADKLFITCTAWVFKISCHIYLISLKVQTHFVIIKIKANYVTKYDFIMIEMAETSLLKHFILFHDKAQSEHISRQIRNLFSSKNKHLETGNQDTLLAPHFGNLSH